MKQKPLVQEEDREQFRYGFRVLKDDHEFVTYPANTSIRVWHRRGDPDLYEEHFHSAVEVLLPIAGECVTMVEGTEYHVRANEVMIIPAGGHHTLRMDAGCERELMLFEMNGVFTMKEFGTFRQLLNKPIYLTTEHPCCERVREIFFEVIRVHRSDALLRNLYSYALLLEIYALLGEDYLKRSASPAEMNALNRQLSGEDAFNRALDYVNENYMDDLSLDTLATYAGFSRYTLSRMFRQHTGSTFTQYLNARRVRMAMELLSGTSMPVTQVALQCGFNSIATFNRVFREIRGCTPTQYRMIYDESQRK
ncbi:MAG: helix-turn-helix transcriptional regulator [Clostridia bacterium]|nr:helix-turn-helix transcriptional regulator [Clostridia bacterium]